MQVSLRIRYAVVAVVLAMGACTQQPQADLGVALKGIDQARFLACSGPPSLEQPSSGQDRMWFVTNLKRGAAIGLLSPTAPAPNPVRSRLCSRISRSASATFGTQSTSGGFRAMLAIVPATTPDRAPPRTRLGWMLRAAWLAGFATVLSLGAGRSGTGGTAGLRRFRRIGRHRGAQSGASDERHAARGRWHFGTVDVGGKVYHFAIGGVGVDGAAVSVIQTVGEAYRLNGSISGFPGTYRRAPSGSVIPGKPSGGLWLQNEHGTLIHLLVPPGGRMPSIGDDGVLIVLQQ